MHYQRYISAIEIDGVMNGDGNGICHQSKMDEAMNGDGSWHDIPTWGTPVKWILLDMVQLTHSVTTEFDIMIGCSIAASIEEGTHVWMNKFNVFWSFFYQNE